MRAAKSTYTFTNLILLFKKKKIHKFKCIIYFLVMSLILFMVKKKIVKNSFKNVLFSLQIFKKILLNILKKSPFQ